jgi:FKBP-type peptidyl-prolyl cis-trans isomerase
MAGGVARLLAFLPKLRKVLSMRFAKITLGVLGIAGLVWALPFSLAQEQETKPAAPQAELKTVKEKFSYGIGRNIGQNIKAREMEVDIAALAKGLEDELAGAEWRVSDADIQAAVEVVEKQMRVKLKQRREEAAKKQIEADPELKAIADKNAQAGEAFLKENQAKEGVKVTQSGLQYQVLKEGQGKKPKESDLVKTHYHGTFPDGSVFDSSVERQKPAVFSVDQVIDGWTEALQLMPVGSKWRLVIPSKLAYGMSGSGGEIGPNQVLVFEVELISIETPEDREDPEGNAAPPAEQPAKTKPPE